MKQTVLYNGIGRVTRLLLWMALSLTVLHHTDHVLRVDHSGWPFREEVTPFTFSLLSYPMGLFALFGPSRFLWFRWSLLGIGATATIFAHVSLESPQMQFAMWAHNRSLNLSPVAAQNLLHVQSDVVGIVAVFVSMSLNIVVVTATIAMLADALRRDDKIRAASRT